MIEWSVQVRPLRMKSNYARKGSPATDKFSSCASECKGRPSVSCLSKSIVTVTSGTRCLLHYCLGHSVKGSR